MTSQTLLHWEKIHQLVCLARKIRFSELHLLSPLRGQFNCLNVVFLSRVIKCFRCKDSQIGKKFIKSPIKQIQSEIAPVKDIACHNLNIFCNICIKTNNWKKTASLTTLLAYVDLPVRTEYLLLIFHENSIHSYYDFSFLSSRVFSN